MKELVRVRVVGDGESHSHPYHVDIQVGSCIFLRVFVKHVRIITIETCCIKSDVLTLELW